MILNFATSSRKLIPFFLSLFIFPSWSTGQAVEIDQVKLVPSVDETNMKLIAFTVWSLYEEALKNPGTSSTPKALDETVFPYYDTEFEGRHEKLKPLRGRKYECTDRKELDSNDRIVFNLRFDPMGNIIVPDTIYAISNRLEEREGKIYTLGAMAFAMYVNDVVREKLQNAKLERIVRSRIAVGGEHPPVEVIVPFNLARREARRTITGHVLINEDKVDFLPEAQSILGENELEVLKSLEYEIACKMLQYKKGDFVFLTEHRAYAYQIDLNIRRNTVWHSTQTKNFTVDVYQAVTLTGTGEKTKQYTNVEKALNNKLAQVNKKK